MNIKKYETFVRVVELGSLTRAAESLGYTQSGVSHVVSSLEDEFGFPLLLRSRGGVRLTGDGERVLPAIRGILNCNEQLNQTVAAIRGLDAGTVRVGTFTSVAVHWLPAMIKEFQDRYPNIEFKLLNGDYHDVEQWLAEGSVDLGFVAFPAELDCRCVPLHEDRLLAVLPPDHRLAAGDSVPLAELKGEPFISLLAASDHDARRAMESVGVHPNVKFETKDDYAIIAMVAQGLGISIMPELLLQGHAEQVAALPLFPSAQRVIGLAIPPTSQNSPATNSFAEHVCAWVRRKYGRTGGE